MYEYTQQSDYEKRMIEAFIDKEEKTLWYQNAFSKFNFNGVDAIKWQWSWWAFFGGFLFLLYRKQYLASVILFILSMSIGSLPILGLVLSILAGGFSTYIVYKGYKSKLNKIESQMNDEYQRVETMKHIGGYHQWVVWLYIVFIILVVLGFISAGISL